MYFSAVNIGIAGTERDDDIECKISLSMIGNAPFYGYLMPHLYEIEFQELYFVSGLTRADYQHGQSFYIDLVIRHIATLQKQCDGSRRIFSQLLIAGEAWAGMQVLQNEDEIRSCLISAVQNREDINMRFHVLINDWRYVTVHKQLLFFFNSDCGTVWKAKSTPTSVYQRLFCSPEAHPSSKKMMADNGGDSSSSAAIKTVKSELALKMEQYVQDGLILPAYNCLLHSSRVDDLFGRDSEYSGGAQPYLAPIWRIFHSAAEELHYLDALNGTMREIINDCLTYSLDTAPLRSNLSRMAQGYASKIREILGRSICLTESTFMKSTIMDDLRSLWELHDSDDESVVAISDKSIHTLEHLSRTLYQLENEWASEIHHLGGKASFDLKVSRFRRDTYATKMCGTFKAEAKTFKRREEIF